MRPSQPKDLGVKSFADVAGGNRLDFDTDNQGPGVGVEGDGGGGKLAGGIPRARKNRIGSGRLVDIGRTKMVIMRMSGEDYVRLAG